MIAQSFSRAVAQATDPAFSRVLLMGIGLTICLLFAVYGLFLWTLDWLLPESFTLPFTDREITWVDDLLSWSSLILMIFLSTFLMIPVASAFTGLFLEDIAAAVEREYYAYLPIPPRIPVIDTVLDSIGFFILLIAVNLFSLLLFVFLPFSLVLFWAINGFLLGREYFQLVAMRRLGRVEAKAARRRHRVTIWVAGTLMAMPLSIPILSLVIPILGVATFTHIFHALEPQD